MHPINHLNRSSKWKCKENPTHNVENSTNGRDGAKLTLPREHERIQRAREEQVAAQKKRGCGWRGANGGREARRPRVHHVILCRCLPRVEQFRIGDARLQGVRAKRACG
jgi:hypothetical protein